MDEPEVPDRAPDRVTYTEWMPVFGPERTRQVATQWSVFKVLEYTEVKDHPIVGYERIRREYWDVRPAPLLVTEGADGLAFSRNPEPTRIIGRAVPEYRGAGDPIAETNRG